MLASGVNEAVRALCVLAFRFHRVRLIQSRQAGKLGKGTFVHLQRAHVEGTPSDV